MVWREGGGNRLARALETLLDQLYVAYPGGQWANSPQTGTLGNLAHQAEATSSDHNPWLDHTVRALDVAADVRGVDGIQDVADAPDCEALFRMVNDMYGRRDPRVFPDGYAIYRRRITDWGKPGGARAHDGDPHLYHLHVSVSTNPAGFDSTAAWPLPGGGDQSWEDDMAYSNWPEADKKELAADVATAIVNRALGGVGYPGSVAQCLKATLDAARAARVTPAALAEQLAAALRDVPAAAGVDVAALATAVLDQMGERLDSGTPA
jgi:hypothetical protein